MSSWASVAAAGAAAAVAAVDAVEEQLEALSFDDFEPSHTAKDAVAKLWEIDTNRLTPGTEYKIDVQGYTRYHGETDYARE